jgi:hypothetical protein
MEQFHDLLNVFGLKSSLTLCDETVITCFLLNYYISNQMKMFEGKM